MVVKIAGAGVALLSQLVLARLMLPADYGIYSFAISWLTTLAMFTRIGADMSFLRYIPVYVAQARWGELRGLLRWGTQVSFWASSAVAVLGGVLVWTAGEERSVGERWTLTLALASMPLLSLSFLRQASLRALRKVVLAELPETVLRFLFVAVFVAGLYVVAGRKVTPLEGMGATVVAFVACFVLGHIWQTRALPTELHRAQPVTMGPEWLRTSLPMLVATSMAMLINQAGIIALGQVGDAEGAGVFAIVVRISMLLGFALMATNSIAAPLIAELHGAGKKTELQRLLTMSARMVTLYTLGAGVVVALLGDWLLSWFGELPRTGYWALLIMAVGQMLNASMGSVTYLVNMTGHHTPGAVIFTGSGLLCVVLNAVLVPLYGLNGAAAATSLSLVISSGLLAVYVKSRLGLRSTIF